MSIRVNYLNGDQIYGAWIQIKNNGARLSPYVQNLRLLPGEGRIGGSRQWQFLSKGILSSVDNQKRLFKYYPGTNEIRCLSLDTYVISPYSENLVSLPLKPSHQYPHLSVETRTSRCRLFSNESSSSWIFQALRRNEFSILEIVFTSLVVAGYIFSPRKQESLVLCITIIISLISSLFFFFYLSSNILINISGFIGELTHDQIFCSCIG